jgi:hypothetical protein
MRTVKLERLTDENLMILCLDSASGGVLAAREAAADECACE